MKRSCIEMLWADCAINANTQASIFKGWLIARAACVLRSFFASKGGDPRARCAPHIQRCGGMMKRVTTSKQSHRRPAGSRIVLHFSRLKVSSNLPCIDNSSVVLFFKSVHDLLVTIGFGRAHQTEFRLQSLRRSSLNSKMSSRRHWW